jgi:hypothetical protein
MTNSNTDKDMTFAEIQAALAEIEKINAEKGYPPIHIDITVFSEKCRVYISRDLKIFDGEDYKFFHGQNPREVLARAKEVIIALPDQDTAKKQAAVHKYGRAVDALREAGFDDVFIAPAKETMKALTKNLLTYHGKIK